MGKCRTILTFSLLLAALLLIAPSARTQEVVVENITIKMVLKNPQVKFIRKAEGEVVSLKLTNAQKQLIRLNAPKYRGNIIRLSSAHLKKGTNKITLLIIKPSSEIPLLRVIPPGKPKAENSSSEDPETTD